MKWDKNLFIGKNIEDKLWKVKWKIKHNAGQLNIYLLNIPLDSKNQLEIIHSAMLLSKYYPKHRLYIVGVAKSYEEALGLILDIAQKTYLETGTGDLKNYILKFRNKEGEL